MSFRCISCLDDFSEQDLKKLCTRCNESRVCKDCLQFMSENNFIDQLSNCPLCQQPTNFHFKPFFIPRFQILTPLFWYAMGMRIVVWKTLVVLYCLYQVMRRLCIRGNTTEASNPRILVKKWNIISAVIHIPYYLYVYYQSKSLGYGDNEDIYLSDYTLSHIFSPLLVAVFFWVHKKISGQ